MISTPLTSRNRAIDFLRGIAIIAVLVHHFHSVYPLDSSALNHIFFVNFINSIAENGNYGVTMFFVISGFLITSTTLERYGSLSKIDVVGFYILRFARIMPCLLLALVIIGFLNLSHVTIFENKANTTSFLVSIFSVLTFWHNVLMEKVGYFNYCLNIFWSLSVEEMFYIVFPIACLFLKKTRFIIPFWLVAIIIGPFFRSHYSNNEIMAVYGYFSCFDAIAIGCCSAIIARKIQLNQPIKKMLQYGAGVFIFITYCCVGIMENIAICFSLIALGTAVLLICAAQPSIQQSQTPTFYRRIICSLGKNSYELYLFHIILLALMKQYIKTEFIGSYEKLALLTLFFIASALIASGIAKFYSQPMNKNLRKILFNLRQKTLFAKHSEDKAYSSERQYS